MAGFTLTSRAKGVVYYLRLIEHMRHLTRPLVQAEGGRVVKYEADNLFAVFEEPAAAMRCLERIFDKTEQLNEGREKEGQLRVCAGLDHGMILLDEADFFGDPVNLASKLGEDQARSGEVLVSGTVRECLQKEPFVFEEVGNHGFYETPHPVYRWRKR
jgi:class 3 adenylate cyclase